MATGDLPHTYSGLLDDVMARYGSRFAGPNFFRRMIAKNLFFGGGMYLNDGYLVNHPDARRYLQEEDSLLSAMLRYGFIRIFTREGNPDALAKMPVKMAKQGNTSFKRLIGSTEWKGVFRKTWARVAEEAFESGHYRRWPKRNMSYGFCKLIQRALVSRPEDVGIDLEVPVQQRILQEFFALRPLDSGPRDKLEIAAKKVVDETGMSSPAKKRAVASIMTVANQAYHFNFGLCLTSETGEERVNGKRSPVGGRADTLVCVDTTLGRAFDEMLLTDEIDEYALKNIPLFGIPAAFRFTNGAVFEPLVTRGTRAFAAKVQFAECIRTSLAACHRRNKSVREVRQSIRDAMMNYAAELIDVLPFSADEKDFLNPDAEHSVWLAAERLSDSVPIAIGSNYGVITHAIARTSKSNALKFLVQRGILSKKKRLTLGEVTPQISSLLFDRQKAIEFVETIPTF